MVVQHSIFLFRRALVSLVSVRERRMRRVVFVGGTLFLCVSSWSFAEPDAAPKELFPPGYAQGVPAPSRDTGGNRNQQAQKKQIPQHIINGLPAEIAAQVMMQVNQAGVAVAGSADPGKTPKSFVMVYVNSLESEHFDRVVRQVVKLHRSGRAHIDALLHVGRYQNITPEQELALTRVGVSIQALASLPEHLGELTSPAWFVFSEGREAYISGEFDVGRFFTRDGELKVPKEGEELGSSEQTIDGF